MVDLFKQTDNQAKPTSQPPNQQTNEAEQDKK